MTPIRPLITFLAQLWFSLDTANALRHGAPVSERARAYCMADPGPAAAERLAPVSA